MKEIVTQAVEMAAHDIAKAVADAYFLDSAGFSKVKRDIRGFLSGIVVQTAGNLACPWLGRNDDKWLNSAADVTETGMDVEALRVAIDEWWDGLGDDKKFHVITGPAGYHDSQFKTNIQQKFEGKPPSKLQTEYPDLFEIYRGKAGGAPVSAPEPEEPRPPKQEPPPPSGAPPATKEKFEQLPPGVK